MAILIAIVVGLLVWHATRANQARLGIRSRRGQIRNMRREIQKFVLRGILVLVILIILTAILLKQYL